MGRSVKLIFWLIVIFAVGFGQWKFSLVQQAVNYVHPTAQIAATSPTSAGGAKRAAPAIAVKLAQAAKADFPLIERSYGTMASPQVVNINARLASQVMKVNVQDGQLVKAGDVLIELDDRTVQATLAKDQATLAKDQSILANNEIQLQRARTLAARNAGTLQDVDNAVAAENSTRQQLSSDQAVIDADKLQVEFAKIKAPFDGKLGTITAAAGAVTSAAGGQAALMTVTQVQPLKVNFRLPEQSLLPVQAAMAKGPVAVRVIASGSSDLLDQGKLVFIDSSVDTSSGTIGMAAEIANSKLILWPGQRVQVEVDYGKIIGALTVPTVAVQQGQIGAFVWLVDEQNKVTAAPVKVARFEGELASISEGLTEGAQVVIEGQAKLNNGSEVRSGKPAEAPQTGDTAEARPAVTGAAQAAPADGSAPKTGKKKDQSGTGVTQP